MPSEIINVILLTLLPFLELRGSIPYGILGTELSWITVFIVAVITNIILAPIAYFIFKEIIYFFLFIKPVKKVYDIYINKTQKTIHKYVDKYGLLGVAIFIGIPLPGSGVYSGALGSYLLGMHFKDFMKAAVVGVLIAGIIVTAVTLTGAEAFRIFIKP